MQELQRLKQQGVLKATTQVSSDRFTWRDASTVEGLFSRGGGAQNAWAEAGKNQARAIVDDLRHMDFRAEIIPIDGSNLQRLLSDVTFWGVALLGIVPLIINSITNPELQLTGLNLFFAALWAVIFKHFVIKDETSWKLPIVALFFTGFIGIPILLFAFAQLPTAYMELPASKSYLVSLFGFVFNVGVCEELCKFLPVIGYILWKRSNADPMTIVLVGIFSGLGFAAFENVIKSSQIILSTLNVKNTTEAAIQVQGGIIMAMTRSLSCVFGHAVYSGIFAYFLATALVTGRRWGALFLVGLLVAATIHGAYDWLCGVQPVIAALWTGIAFMLFYGYIAKLRGMIGTA